MGLFSRFKEKVSSSFDKVTEQVNKKVGDVISQTGEALKFKKIKGGLEKTRNNLISKFESILGVGRKVDESLIEDIEDILITSDMGVQTTDDIIEKLRLRIKKEKVEDSAKIYNILKEEIHNIIMESPSAEKDKTFETDESNKPLTILVIGVNGVGKTTSIGKLAYNYRKSGKDVIIGAADTFRAAANEQLEIWAKRAEVEIVQQKQGADPAAVSYDTLKAAISRNKDVVLIDTAGRLHNKMGLMQELEKISRVLKKLKDNTPDEVYLVLDATTGQNAILQAKEFSKVANITGIILTKLDGTAKGGVVIPIINELKIPVRYIGVGEQIDDLQPFDPAYFIEGLVGITETEETEE
jgi:fused signal recognition particle receptor